MEHLTIKFISLAIILSELYEVEWTKQPNIDRAEGRSQYWFLWSTQPGSMTVSGHNKSWVRFRDKYYMFVGEKMTWMEAQTVCNSIGGFLATVSSESENRFLKSMTHVSANDVWLGGTDMFAEGKWVWIENMQSISYTNWYTANLHEPSGGQSQQCLIWFRYRGTHFWHDIDCSHKSKFICQKRTDGKQKN